MIKSMDTQVRRIPYHVWENMFTREELREFAKLHGIPRGRDKAETISNIRDRYLKIRVTLDLTGNADNL